MTTVAPRRSVPSDTSTIVELVMVRVCAERRVLRSGTASRRLLSSRVSVRRACAVTLPPSELDLGVVGIRPHVNAVDEPDPVRLVLHDHRAGADAVAEVAHAFHQRAVGDTGCRENDVLARREILRAVHALEV